MGPFPDIVYFDWWIGQALIRANLARFAAFYYNRSQKYGDHVGLAARISFTFQAQGQCLRFFSL